MKILIILFPLLLIACAEVEPRTSPVAPPSTAEEVSTQVKDCAGLSYYHALSGLSAEEQQQALIVLRQQLPSTEDPSRELCLALLLSQGEADLRNETEAERLLKFLLDSPADTREEEQALATLLLEVIELRKQAKDNRMKIRGLKRSLKKAQKSSEGYQNQLIELKSQLEQLQSLEQVIDQQEQAINPPPAGNDGTK